MTDIIILIVVGIVVVVTAAATVYVVRKKKGTALSVVVQSAETPQEKSLVPSESVSKELVIPIELLPSTAVVDTSSLVEIKDRAVISRLTQSVPAVVDIAARTIASNAASAALQQTANIANAAVQKVTETLRHGDIFRAILPSGANPASALVQSTAMDGAVRGFARGAVDITEHANFIPVVAEQAAEVAPAAVAKGASVATGVATVMNVASLVVGQYYMSVIDNKLEKLSKEVRRIADFQDREFKSRILSVILLVGEISQFNAEIMEDDEQRKRKLSSLENHKSEATQLLGQVNISISDITQKNANPDYKAYESLVEELQLLCEYQNILVTVLEKISSLTYLLGRGSVSTEQSHAIYRKYLDHTKGSRSVLKVWHDTQVAALRIDLEKERRKKKGFDEVISTLFALVDDKIKYRTIPSAVVQKISAQANRAASDLIEVTQDVYDADVELIIMDGKYYYSPQTETKIAI